MAGPCHMVLVWDKEMNTKMLEVKKSLKNKQILENARIVRNAQSAEKMLESADQC